MYKVILVPAGCMQTVLDVGIIESNANTMSEKGYELVQVLQTNTAACIGTKNAVIMVFKQRAS